jgi:hypothetical protein
MLALMLSATPSVAASKGKACGGAANIKCDGTLWCDPDPGKCGAADLQGKCVVVPGDCSDRDQTDVCGCNNKIYFNDCYRLRDKEQKKADGPCTK